MHQMFKDNSTDNRNDVFKTGTGPEKNHKTKFGCSENVMTTISSILASLPSIKLHAAFVLYLLIGNGSAALRTVSTGTYIPNKFGPE